MTSTNSEVAGREKALQIANECISAVPVMVLGSGASAAYGISGMPKLTEYLLTNVRPSESDNESWSNVKTELVRGQDLESALKKVALTDGLLKQIVFHTRRIILEDDQRIYNEILAGGVTLSLAHLFKSMFRSTHQIIHVVTTNYDRLVEYAACQAGFRFNTGFTDGAVRHFNCQKSDPKHYTRHANFRCIDIWKVHGSIDWFQSDSEPLGVFDHATLPESFSPLIVTPGVAKYSRTHQEPFRSVITNADESLKMARGFLCVGYGFADDHIEPKLISRSRQIQPPVIILAKDLRPGSREFLMKHMHSKVVAFVEDAAGTRAYTEGSKDGVVFAGESLWSLEGLIKKLEIH